MFGGVERSGAITHLGQRRSHGWGLPAQCSAGAQSGAALPARLEYTLCMMPGQRWSAALPRLVQCTLCFHPAFLKCACRDMPHQVPAAPLNSLARPADKANMQGIRCVHEAGTLCCVAQASEGTQLIDEWVEHLSDSADPESLGVAAELPLVPVCRLRSGDTCLSCPLACFRTMSEDCTMPVSAFNRSPSWRQLGRLAGSACAGAALRAKLKCFFGSH